MKIYFFQGFRQITNFDIERNLLDELNRKYYLEIIDVKNLINKNNNYFLKKQSDNLKNYKISKINNIFTLFKKLIKIQKRSLIIIEGLDVQLISLLIYFLLKIKKCIIIRHAFSLGFFEIYQKLYSNKFKSKKNKFNFKIKKIVIFFINTYKHFLRKFFTLKSDYFIYSGYLNSLISKNERKTNTKFLSFYSYEFRKCKEKKIKNIILKDKYALFIDQGIGYHSETIGLNHNELESFYKNLNN